MTTTIPQAARRVERLARMLGKFARRCATRDAALWSLTDDFAHNVEHVARNVGATDPRREQVLECLRPRMPRFVHRSERLRRRVLHVRKMLVRAETQLRTMLAKEEKSCTNA